jgi:hypothetical protein
MIDFGHEVWKRNNPEDAEKCNGKQYNAYGILRTEEEAESQEKQAS